MAQQTILDNPYVVYLVIIGIAGFLIYRFFIKDKKGMFKYQEFKPIKSEDTIYLELKKKIRSHGHGIKAKLFKGTNNIAIIDKWLRAKGKFDRLYYNTETKEYTMGESKEKVPYDFLVLRAKNKFWLYRVLGIKKYFFILNYDSLHQFDPVKNTFILDDDSDLISIGEIWTNSQSGMEYMMDFSVKQMNLEIMSQLESYPKKVVHLEMRQAAKERFYEQMADIDRSKWDQIKKAEDTVIE